MTEENQLHAPAALEDHLAIDASRDPVLVGSGVDRRDAASATAGKVLIVEGSAPVVAKALEDSAPLHPGDAPPQPEQRVPTLDDIFAFVVRRSQEPEASEPPELVTAMQTLERNAMFFEFFLASSTLYPKEDHEIADGLLYSIANDRYMATTKTQLHAIDTFLRLLEPRADMPDETAEARLERIKMLLLSDQAHVVRGARKMLRGMLHNVTLEYAQIAQSLKGKLELFQPLHTMLHEFYAGHAEDALVQLGITKPESPRAEDAPTPSTDPASTDAANSSPDATADDAASAPL